jgi:peptidoglycan/LPS O-acetylase OafA/YrhL
VTATGRAPTFPAGGAAAGVSETAGVGRLAFADGLRGFAALWVVLFHASGGGHLDQLKALLPPLVAKVVFEMGELGVPVFFVLSGFVMALTVDSASVGSAFAWRFIARRLVRLTPPYWFSIAVVIAFALVKAGVLHLPPKLPTVPDLLAHLVYLQGVFEAVLINPIYWTLGVEVQFYIAFALLMLVADTLQRRGIVRNARLVVGALSALLALAWPAGWVQSPVWPGGFLPFWFSFMAGVLACWGWRQRGAHALLFWAFVAALAVTAWADRSAFTIASVAAAVALSVAGWRGAMGRWLNLPAIQFVGLVSYSLYLLHNPLTGSGFNVVKRLLPAGAATEAVGLAATLAICLFCSYLAYRFVEQPSQRWSRLISLKRSTRGAALRTT